jgi:CHAT domain-containing protein
LIEDYQVNYVTAFSLTSLNKPKISNPTVLAGAYTDQKKKLPQAKPEIDAIATEFPKAVLLFEKTFNRAAFTPERLNQFNFIHLATHGKLDPKSPELSFISFNNDESINLKEIQNWQLPNVNLVTLSACESSLGGKEPNGIEVLGFGYQFQLAKVDATISTLWTVDDNGTSQLMQRFYSYLKQGQSPNAALRLAQIDLIQGKVTSKSQNLSHPLYWAPFILVGNGF